MADLKPPRRLTPPTAPVSEASLVTAMMVFSSYGLRLDTRQLAEVLGCTPGGLRNQISEGTCPIPTYIENNKRWADYREVAAHFDRCAAAARAAQQQQKFASL